MFIYSVVSLSLRSTKLVNLVNIKVQLIDLILPSLHN